MTHKEEEAFLASHLATAQKGWLLTARKIKESYEEQVGHAIPESTVCRMLKRNDWRVISTRPTHPDGDPAAREEFKKLRQRMVAAELMAAVYWSLQGKLEARRFDVFGPMPVKLSKPAKLTLAFGAWLRFVAARKTMPYGTQKLV